MNYWIGNHWSARPNPRLGIQGKSPGETITMAEFLHDMEVRELSVLSWPVQASDILLLATYSVEDAERKMRNALRRHRFVATPPTVNSVDKTR